MGIAVKENFNRPYFSQSITEMYTRWHMTLSEWMRDIVFFPLAAFLMRRATWLTRYRVVRGRDNDGIYPFWRLA